MLKVTQQSEKHLEKILNVDEFVKRVFSVIHSNDPVARAITLRYTQQFNAFSVHPDSECVCRDDIVGSSLRVESSLRCG